MREQTLDIATRDGAMETFVVHPDRGAHPPVLLLMDAPGIRDELRDMARRLATVGYYVMLPNLYYRAGRDTMYGPDVLTKGSTEQERMRAVRTKMTIPPVMDDVAAMIAWQMKVSIAPSLVAMSSVRSIISRSPILRPVRILLVFIQQ